MVAHRCLLCKCYSAAVPVLCEEAFEVDPSKTALTATDFLLYCYYGARIHIGERSTASLSPLPCLLNLHGAWID